MYSNLTRDQVRGFFCNAWSKYLVSDNLTPIEQIAIHWIIQHPEWHPLIGASQETFAHEYTPEEGKTNPFLHLSLHLAISEQVSIDLPKGIRDAYHTLIKKKGSEHNAAHEVMECLGEAIWMSQRHKMPIDMDSYIRCVKRIARSAKAVRVS